MRFTHKHCLIKKTLNNRFQSTLNIAFPPSEIQLAIPDYGWCCWFKLHFENNGRPAKNLEDFSPCVKILPLRLEACLGYRQRQLTDVHTGKQFKFLDNGICWNGKNGFGKQSPLVVWFGYGALNNHKFEHTLSFTIIVPW